MSSDLRTVIRFSARELDPMSWFTGPYLPLVFAAMIAAYGVLMSVVTWRASELPWFQLVGVLVCVLTCLMIQFLTSRRTRYQRVLGPVALLGGGAGLVISAFGYSDSVFAIELWWAPVCFAFVQASLAPYLAPWRVFVYGIAGLLTTVPLAFVIVDPRVPDWGSVSVLIIIATPVAIEVAAATAFSVSVVRRVLPIVDNRSTSIVSERLEVHPDDERTERELLARLTARAVPFLRLIAERGTVTSEDRALAGELSRYLRDDLVARSDLAWLGLNAEDRRVVVIDPDHRADRMRRAQLDAIRDLVRAVLDHPQTDATTMLIELRVDSGDPDATAVAITLDADLPEGRRVRHLAPYYFNLQGEMTHVRLGRDRMSFKVPPRERGDGGVSG